MLLLAYLVNCLFIYMFVYVCIYLSIHSFSHSFIFVFVFSCCDYLLFILFFYSFIDCCGFVWFCCLRIELKWKRIFEYFDNKIAYIWNDQNYSSQFYLGIRPDHCYSRCHIYDMLPSLIPLHWTEVLTSDITVFIPIGAINSAIAASSSVSSSLVRSPFSLPKTKASLSSSSSSPPHASSLPSSSSTVSAAVPDKVHQLDCDETSCWPDVAFFRVFKWLVCCYRFVLCFSQSWRVEMKHATTVELKPEL